MSLDQTEPRPPSSFTTRTSPVATTRRTAQPAAEENRRTSSIGAGASARRRARRSTRIGTKPPTHTLAATMCRVWMASWNQTGEAAAACPPAARAAAVTMPARPRRTNPQRAGEAATVIAATRTTSAAPRSHTYARPVSDDRRSPRDTPSEERSANSITIAPAAAKQPAAIAIDRRPGISGPIVHRPASATPIERRMPMYSIALPMTEVAEGVGVEDCWVWAGPTEAGSTPTPNAKEPADACPSADETTVHDTV